jgi:hypothetical protein
MKKGWLLYVVWAVIWFMLVGGPKLIWGQALDQTHFGYYNPLLNGTTCDDVTLAAAVADADSASTTIFLTKTTRAKVACNWTLNASINIPTTRHLHIPPGTTVTLGAATTLTACLDIGDYEVFAGTGDLVIPAGCNGTVKAAWFPKTHTGLDEADTLEPTKYTLQMRVQLA